MYGPFVPDMYSRNFVHYDKFAGSDPILEKPITTTGYSDLVSPPTGSYELIQPVVPPLQPHFHHRPHRPHRPREHFNPSPFRPLHPGMELKERFDGGGIGSGIKFLLVTIFFILAIYFLMGLVSSQVGHLSGQTYFFLFLVFVILWLAVSFAF